MIKRQLFVLTEEQSAFRKMWNGNRRKGKGKKIGKVGQRTKDGKDKCYLESTGDTILKISA